MEKCHSTDRTFTIKQIPKHIPRYEDNILQPTVELTPLFLAVFENSVPILKVLMKYGVNVDSEKMFDYTPLSFACQLGYYEISKALIEYGADLSVKTITGNTLLHLAIVGDSVKLVQLLLEKGFDVNCKNTTQETPLFYAVSNNSYNMVKFLIEQGSNVNVKCNTFRYCYKTGNEVSPLLIAALNGNFAMVKLLTECGASINFKVDNIFTPLHAACNSGCIQIVKHFLNINADYNMRNSLNVTPLHYAVECNHIEIVKYLLSLENIKYDIQDAKGFTPFLLACAKGEPEIIEAFLNVTYINTEVHETKKQYGVRINVASNSWGPIHFLVTHQMPHKILRNLFDKDHNIHRRISDGRTILHLAAEYSHYDVVKLIIKYGGSDANMKDKKGWTALHYASYAGCLPSILVLLEHRSNINSITNTRNTPLHIAINSPNSDNVLDTVLFLLARKADPNAVDETGWGALHYAIKEEKDILVAFLLHYGANINCREMEYLKAPIHLAVQIKSHSILQLLIKHGADPNIRMAEGLTALNQAAHLGNLEAVKILIKGGAYYDVKGPNKALIQPIHFSEYNYHIREFLQLHQELFEAVKSNDPETINFCLDQGAIIDCKSSRHKTLLIFSVFLGYIEMSKFLINIGANVNMTVEGNTTALHYAVRYKRFEIMCSLLENGAQYDIVASDGKSPLNMADGVENVRIYQLLQTLDDLFHIFKQGRYDKVHHMLLKLKRTKTAMEFRALLGSRNFKGQTLKFSI